MHGWQFENVKLDAPAAPQELVFLRLLAANCKMFSLNSSRVCCDPSKVGTGRRALPGKPRARAPTPARSRLRSTPLRDPAIRQRNVTYVC